MAINDSIPCDNCGSDVFLSVLTCEYCSTSLGEKNPSKTILSEINKIDRLEIEFKYDDAIVLVKNSEFNRYNLYTHRLARISLKNAIIGNDYIDNKEFLNSVNLYNTLIKTDESIKTEIITIVESLLPNYSVRMNLKTYRSILHKISKNRYLASVSDLFTKQMVCEELGEKAFKEYVYYTKPSNQMSDVFFQKKKEYILNLYNEKLKLLNNE